MALAFSFSSNAWTASPKPHKRIAAVSWTMPDGDLTAADLIRFKQVISPTREQNRAFWGRPFRLEATMAKPFLLAWSQTPQGRLYTCGTSDSYETVLFSRGRAYERMPALKLQSTLKETHTRAQNMFGAVVRVAIQEINDTALLFPSRGAVPVCDGKPIPGYSEKSASKFKEVIRGHLASADTEPAGPVLDGFDHQNATFDDPVQSDTFAIGYVAAIDSIDVVGPDGGVVVHWDIQQPKF
jgi:hypothetical protein